jgi:hypothetical protein
MDVPGFAASSGRPMPSAFVGRPTQHDHYQSLPDLQQPSQALRKKGIAHHGKYGKWMKITYS